MQNKLKIKIETQKSHEFILCEDERAVFSMILVPRLGSKAGNQNSIGIGKLLIMNANIYAPVLFTRNGGVYSYKVTIQYICIL